MLCTNINFRFSRTTKLISFLHIQNRHWHVFYSLVWVLWWCVIPEVCKRLNCGGKLRWNASTKKLSRCSRSPGLNPRVCNNVRFEIFTAVLLRIQVWWDETLHCQMSGSWGFKDHNAFISRVSQSSFRWCDPSRQKYHDPYKHQEQLTQWHDITTLNICNPLCAITLQVLWKSYFFINC